MIAKHVIPAKMLPQHLELALQWIRNIFAGLIISRFGDIFGPQRSSDLTGPNAIKAPVFHAYPEMFA
jgi:hypothetical protein